MTLEMIVKVVEPTSPQEASHDYFYQLFLLKQNFYPFQSVTNILIRV